MSRYQKFVIIFACIAVVAMCIYPPKYVKLSRYYNPTQYYKSIGYYYFNSQPGWVDDDGRPHKVLSCRIDKERLGVQILAVLAFGVGLFVIAPKRKHEKET